MTSWLAVVRGGRGRPRAAHGDRCGSPTGVLRTAGTLGVLVAGLVVGPYGATGAAYCFEGPRGPTASGASSGSPAASRTPSEPSVPAALPRADSENPSNARPSSPGPTAESRPSSSATGPSGSPSASSGGSGESGRPGKPGKPGQPGRSEQSRQDAKDTNERNDKNDRNDRQGRQGRQDRHETHSGESPTPSAHGPGAFRPAPSDEPSRAGSRAGEGRERPGREKGPLEDEEAAARHEPYGREGDRERDQEEDGDAGRPPAENPDGADETSTDPLAPADPPARQPVAHTADPAEPVLQVLPLGTGLVLIGLGLGLAFVGLRLRRG